MITEKKNKLRLAVKEETAQLEAVYCRKADEQICRSAVSLAEYKAAKTIFCYVGTDREINTRPLLEDILKSGKVLGVPRCISKGKMEVFRICTLDQLREGAYGILEPEEGCEKIEPDRIDLAFVPCMTCTREGQRLGYGGGYYDRYLENTPFPKAVLCRKRLMKERLPMEEHDVIMDLVISEDGIE